MYNTPRFGLMGLVILTVASERADACEQLVHVHVLCGLKDFKVKKINSHIFGKPISQIQIIPGKLIMDQFGTLNSSNGAEQRCVQ